MRTHTKRPMIEARWTFATLLLFVPLAAGAAGTLTPVGSPHQPIQTRDHRVEISIVDGFATTEVWQTFYNPNDEALEAIFTLPLPQQASLSEMSILLGETEIDGEVLARSEAERLYEEEKSRGHDAGLATKESFQSFDFRVTPVPPNDTTTIRFLYLQPLVVDHGVGRYLYPMEDGGTDEEAKSFWLREEAIAGSLSLRVDLRSSWPLAAVRVPGYESAARLTELEEDHYEILLERQGGGFDQDFVVYYSLAEDLPGRLEMRAYRPDPKQPGTFMLVVTPALDLAPLARGSDFVFVLDVSGSMEGKLSTLADAVAQSLGELSPEDRFRIVTFNDRAGELTGGFLPATPDGVDRALELIRRMSAGGSTNVYEGLQLALDDLDDDRATSVLLVTDGVTNTGIIEPQAFHTLMKAYDVRVFGFLLGNSGNWPLMRTICDASGGFFAQVSNRDDVIGQVLLAKSKVTHESLTDAQLSISGIDEMEVTGSAPGKVYRGQQLVLFGRYRKSGEATVKLAATLTGQDRVYSTRFDFPEVDTELPELERLWALARIEEIEARIDAGLLHPEEGDQAVEGLGVEYQIVTDQTAMVVLSDAAFEEHGVERRNRDRVAVERQARQVRRAQPVRNRRQDEAKPMFEGRKAPRLGGGAFDPLTGLLLASFAASLAIGRRKR